MDADPSIPVGAEFSASPVLWVSPLHWCVCREGFDFGPGGIVEEGEVQRLGWGSRDCARRGRDRYTQETDHTQFGGGGGVGTF